MYAMRRRCAHLINAYFSYGTAHPDVFCVCSLFGAICVSKILKSEGRSHVATFHYSLEFLSVFISRER